MKRPEPEIARSRQWDNRLVTVTMTIGGAGPLEFTDRRPHKGCTIFHPMLTLENITKRYGALTALDGVSLQIEPGECFGLLGPNGAGKSTLMSLVAGLRAADTGRLALDGQPLDADHPAVRLQLGLVPQHIALYQELSPDQNLGIFGQLYGLRGALLRERVEEALVAVQLVDRRKDQVKNFSGGMQR